MLYPFFEIAPVFSTKSPQKPFRNGVFNRNRHEKGAATQLSFCNSPFCRRAFLLPAIFLPLLEQPFSLFRLVKCLDLGQQEPSKPFQLLLGYAVLPVLGGRRCLCCFLLLPIFRSGSLYYRVVVIRAPLQGLCYTVRDAVDWLAAPTTRWFKKGSNHSPLQFC